MREYLKEMRKGKGLTQKEVASSLGITQQNYCQIESGQRQKKMDIDTAYKIAENFGVSVDKIMEYERG